MKQFFKDLFYGVGNVGADLGRVGTAWAILTTSALAVYKMVTGHDVSLQEYANSLQTTFMGCGVFLVGKDIARGVATKIESQANPPPQA